MSVFIPFHKYKYLGGPSTFMWNLKNYLIENNIEYKKIPFFAETIFFPIEHNLFTLKYFQKKDAEIIQRLDGIYYPEKHGERYKSLNKKIKNIYQKYSTKIIFQSEHSKNQCFELFGEHDHYEIINNGVDKKIYYPNTKKRKSEKMIFITTGNFREIDMIEPVVLALDELKKDFNFELRTIGPIVDKSLNRYFKRDYITHLGVMNHHEIAIELRAADIFIYSHLNPPCPNSVLEAISSGLPVVGFDSGSMKELCYFSNDLLADVKNVTFQEYKDFDSKKLKEKLILAIEMYDHYKKIALENSSKFSFDECGSEYVKVLNL